MALTKADSQVIEQTLTERTLNNPVVDSPSFQGISIENYVDLINSTGVVAHDLSVTSIWVHTSISGTVTPNFTNMPSLANKALTVTLIFVQGSTPRTVASNIQINGSSQSVTWIGGTVPGVISNANKIDVWNYTFIYQSNGTILRVLGSLTTYG